MNEEEKWAIEKIKEFNQYNFEMNALKEKEYAIPYFDALDTILNLINKQQKEIEDLKNDHIDFWINTKEVEDMVRGKFINKDKIKEKIKKIKEDEEFYRERDRMYEFDGKINILEELLGE